jgi:hypothetical protein
MSSYIFLAAACPDYDFGQLSGPKSESTMQARRGGGWRWLLRFGFLKDR